jgi:hypothetical protein
LRKAALLAGVGFAACLCIIISIFTAYQYWWNWSSSKKSESIQLGNKIIKALRSYRSDHGCFPDNLEALVPAYLPTIPNPTAGVRRWAYFVEPDKQTFRLQFSTRDGYPSMNYCSFLKDAEWYEDN